MHTLNQHTREALSRKVGLTYRQMQEMSAEEIDAHIEGRMGKKLSPAASLRGFVNRGSVFLYFKRLLPSHTIDHRLAQI